MNGIYIHIPFCTSKCNYCTFASGYTDNEEAYFKALLDEIKNTNKPFSHADTIYIGGGTPTKVSVSSIESVINALSTVYDLSSVQEFTIEANPESVTDAKISAYADMGINRLSLGVQSENDQILSNLGRIHDSAMTVKALETIFRHFSNVSVDYIWGIEGGDVNVSLPELFPIRHISAYALSVEDGSMLQRNRYKQKCEEATIEEYRNLLRQLRAYGFERYEVSNFARDGQISVHNSLYWDRGNAYIGYGLSASSFYGNSRYANTQDMTEYLTSGRFAEEEKIDERTARVENVMLGLRTAKGIDISLVNNAITGELKERGLAETRNGRIFLTDNGFILLDSIIEEIISDYN